MRGMGPSDFSAGVPFGLPMVGKSTRSWSNATLRATLSLTEKLLPIFADIVLQVVRWPPGS
jgi:hypothetical protein